MSSSGAAGPVESRDSEALATLASRLCNELAPGASEAGAESAADREPLKSIDNAVFEPRHHSPIRKELEAEAASLQDSLVRAACVCCLCMPRRLVRYS